MSRFICISFIVLVFYSCSSNSESTESVQPETLVVTNGGPNGVGEIFEVNEKNLTSRVVFDPGLPGIHPKFITEKENGNLVFFVKKGGKYDNGLLYEYDPKSQRSTPLLHLVEAYSNVQLTTFVNQVYFLGRTNRKTRFFVQNGENQPEALFEVDATKFIKVGDSLVFYGNRSLFSWRPNGVLKGLIAPKENENITAFTYDENMDFVGGVSRFIMGPSENPFIMPDGGYLFRYDPKKMSIESIVELDVSEIKKVLILEDKIFCQASGVEAYLYQNEEAKLISFPDGYHSPEVWYGMDDAIFGFIRKDNQEYLFRSDAALQDLATLSQVTSPDQLFLASNGNQYIVSGNDKDGTIDVFDGEETTNLIALGVNDGTKPIGNLVKMGEAYYGIVSEGAGFGDGGIFKMDLALTRKQIIHSFSPETGFRPMMPTIVHQGKLYGLLRRGGAEGKGALYSFDPISDSFKVLYNFPEKYRFPNFMGMVNNNLYVQFSGKSQNKVQLLEFNLETTQSNLKEMQGIASIKEFIMFKNQLIIMGTKAKRQSAIFKLDMPGFKLTETIDVPHTVGGYSNLTLVGNKIFGTSYYNENNKPGFLWSMDLATNDFKKIQEFDVSPVGLDLINGDLYVHVNPKGERQVYRYNTDSNQVEALFPTDKSVETSEVSDSEDTPAEKQYITIIGNDIWVRDAPSDGEVIMKLNDGVRCELLEKGKYEEIRGMKDYWYRIKFDGKEGWVYGAQTDYQED